MPSDDVTIRLKEDTWAKLNRRKKPGDSFDDVIQRLLEEHDGLEEALDEGNPRAATSD